jgi:hypothetical protein
MLKVRTIRHKRLSNKFISARNFLSISLHYFPKKYDKFIVVSMDVRVNNKVSSALTLETNNDSSGRLFTPWLLAYNTQIILDRQ